MVDDPLALLTAEVAVLAQEIRGMRADVTSLKQQQEALKREFREEMTTLRGDWALVSSRQNSAITDNKKNREARHRD